VSIAVRQNKYSKPAASLTTPVVLESVSRSDPTTDPAIARRCGVLAQAPAVFVALWASYPRTMTTGGSHLDLGAAHDPRCGARSTPERSRRDRSSSAVSTVIGTQGVVSSCWSAGGQLRTGSAPGSGGVAAPILWPGRAVHRTATTSVDANGRDVDSQGAGRDAGQLCFPTRPLILSRIWTARAHALSTVELETRSPSCG
jgi:hypothetical protein